MKSKWKVPYVDFVLQHKSMRNDLHACLERLLESGQFILGPEVESFEKVFADYIGVKHAIGVGNGTDALFLSLKALGIGKGDEVITVPNSYLASASSIALTGATPVFVDVADDFNIDPNLIERSITKKTCAIVPVHLTGYPARMERINEIATSHNLPVIEDAAQAVGAKYNDQKVGSIGLLGCFSMHPLKNLNALGDAGVITTNDDGLANWLRKARSHGQAGRDSCDFWSHNMRIDALQAAFLKLKLKGIDAVAMKRRVLASKYFERLSDLVNTPKETKESYSVYHTYIIQCEQRDGLKDYLADNGIDSKVHYPTPIHLLKSAGYLNSKNKGFANTELQSRRILSLPIAEYLSSEQIDFVIEKVREFCS